MSQPNDDEKREHLVDDLMPNRWDKGAYEWTQMLKNLASTIPGVKMTGSGGGDGFADFSFNCEGRMFSVEVASGEALKRRNEQFNKYWIPRPGESAE